MHDVLHYTQDEIDEEEEDLDELGFQILNNLEGYDEYEDED
jgi:hypothetical protein